MLNRKLRNFVLITSVFMLLLNTETADAQERNSDWKIIPATYGSSSSSVTLPLIFNTNHNKVQIIWNSLEDASVSHYIIEHSKDGKNFRQLAVFFTEDNSDKKEYEYNFAVPSKLCYYRLVSVNKAGREERSAVQTYNIVKK